MPANRSAALRLESVRLPFRPKERVRRCLTDPMRQFLGLLTEEGLHVLSYQGGLADPLRFDVPNQPRASRSETVQVSLFGKIVNVPVPRVADPPPIAIHPRGDRLAFVTDAQATLLGPAGNESQLVYTFEDAQAAHVKAALFSCSGEVLWISRELPQDMSRMSLPDPWHEVLALSTGDFKLLGRATARGEVQAGHTLAAHPTLDTVGLEVSCGQDGSWITFASVQDGHVVRLEQHVDGDSDPFSFAGFAPDGASLITTGESTIEEFQWPGCQSIAKAQSNSYEDEGEGELYFGWNGAYVGQFFFGLAEGEEDNLLRAFVCPGLRPIDELDIKPSAKQLDGTLYGLGNDLLIADGSGGIRAWRVTGK